MNIIYENTISGYSACTGDLLIMESHNGTEQYLMFCETTSTTLSSKEGFSKFYFVDIEEGFMFDLELHNDDEIRIGYEIDGCGKVKKIIPNKDIDLLLHESR